MATLYRSTLTVMFAVVVALLSTFVESQDYGICANQFMQSCNEANTTAGAIKCCSWISQEYSADKSCLCYIFGAAELNNSAELQFLNACGVDTTGVGTVCPAGAPVPPSVSPSAGSVGSPPAPPSQSPTSGAPVAPSVSPSSGSVGSPPAPPSQSPTSGAPVPPSVSPSAGSVGSPAPPSQSPTSALPSRPSASSPSAGGSLESPPAPPSQSPTSARPPRPSASSPSAAGSVQSPPGPPSGGPNSAPAPTEGQTSGHSPKNDSPRESPLPKSNHKAAPPPSEGWRPKTFFNSFGLTAMYLFCVFIVA